MSRGSKPGERRGGRQRATPNRRTILSDRILAAGAEHPSASARQFILILVTDQALPADTRIAIARRAFSAGAARSKEAGAARLSAGKPQRIKSATATKSGMAPVASTTPTDKAPKPEPIKPMKAAGLKALFTITQEATASSADRRKAAAEAAKYFLPKIGSNRRWGFNAIPDNYGFAIDPDIAKEYRDAKMQLRSLVNSRGHAVPAIAQAIHKLRAGMDTIQRRLQCPGPEIYGIKQLAKDLDRLDYFRSKHDSDIALTEAEDAEEAHTRARFDSFTRGPEATARQHLKDLKDKERYFNKVRLFKEGPRRPLSRQERNNLRLLRMLYTPSKPRREPEEKLDDPSYHPFRDEPVAEDGNLYPPDSKLRPAPKTLDDDDFTEFGDIAPVFYGDPSDPRSTDPNCPHGEPVPDPS